MLVISRRKDEGFRIDTADGPIHIVNLGHRNGQDRYGIDATAACKVTRDELLPIPAPEPKEVTSVVRRRLRLGMETDA